VWTPASHADSPVDAWPWFPDIPGDRVHKGPPDNLKQSYALLAIGFDDNRRAILCQDSFGSKRSDRPARFWLPYSFIIDYEATDDFWTFRLFNDESWPRRQISAHEIFRPSKVEPLRDGWKIKPVDANYNASNVAIGPTCTIAAASRKPGTAEFWWVTSDGAVDGAFYYDDYPLWRKYHHLLAPAGSVDEGGITGLAIDENNHTVIWIAADGAVMYADGNGWPENPSKLAGAGRAQSNSGIAAMSRNKGKIELFFVGPNGSLVGAWRDRPGEQWHTYDFLPAGSAASNSSLQIVRCNDNSLVFFWIGPDGSVRSRTHKGSSGFSSDFDIISPAGLAALTSRLTAVKRWGKEGILDVFWIAPDGSVKWVTDEDEDSDWKP
jgi:hypothetical protein